MDDKRGGLFTYENGLLALLGLLAGRLADLSDKTTPLLLMTVCSIVGGVLCFFLRETAPVRVRAVQPAL